MAAYFSSDFEKFFIELSRNNHKDWFDENRKRYTKEVKEPFLQLTNDFIAEAKKLDKRLDMDAKRAIFRINKDIRFSADKSPYKLHVAAAVNGSNNKDWNNPHGLYFQLSAEGIWLAGGLYMPDKHAIENIRVNMAQKPKELEKAIGNADFKKIFKGKLLGEKNKVIAKELKEAATKQPLIFNKQFYFSAEYKDPKYVTKKNLLEFLITHLKAGMPVTKYLEKAMA